MSCPVDMLCRVLVASYDAESFDLTMEVHRMSRRCRLEWVRTSGVAIDDGFYFGEFLLNYMGRTTFMPCFNSYDKLWKTGFPGNPLDVQWLNYNKDDVRSSEYLATVVTALSEQVTLWGVDEDTRVCQAFVYFCEFVDSLQSLYLHTVSNWLFKLG